MIHIVLKIVAITSCFVLGFSKINAVPATVVSENTAEKSNGDAVATESTNKGDKWPLLDEELVQRFGPLFVPKVATPHNIESHSTDRLKIIVLSILALALCGFVYFWIKFWRLEFDGNMFESSPGWKNNNSSFKQKQNREEKMSSNVPKNERQPLGKRKNVYTDLVSAKRVCQKKSNTNLRANHAKSNKLYEQTNTNVPDEETGVVARRGLLFEPDLTGLNVVTTSRKMDISKEIPSTKKFVSKLEGKVNLEMTIDALNETAPIKLRSPSTAIDNAGYVILTRDEDTNVTKAVIGHELPEYDFSVGSIPDTWLTPPERKAMEREMAKKLWDAVDNLIDRPKQSTWKPFIAGFIVGAASIYIIKKMVLK